MENILIKNGDVLHAGWIDQSADVRVEGGKIVEIGRGLEPGPGSNVIDATGLYLLPGLIDIHTHGLRDVWVDRDDIHKYSRYQAENGVTACVATLAARPQQDVDRMRQILAETHDFALTPNIAGFRPEILYLAKPGGGDAGALVRPDPALTEALWEASGGRIVI
jgi:N-acetylglucosamine-6-phosphate deacetylase